MFSKDKMAWITLVAFVLVVGLTTGFAAAHEKDVGGAEDHPLTYLPLPGIVYQIL